MKRQEIDRDVLVRAAAAQIHDISGKLDALLPNAAADPILVPAIVLPQIRHARPQDDHQTKVSVCVCVCPK